MINFYEVNETQQMIEHENLDVRTITLGISLLDCIDSNLESLNQKIYEKITRVAENLVTIGKRSWSKLYWWIFSISVKGYDEK